MQERKRYKSTFSSSGSDKIDRQTDRQTDKGKVKVITTKTFKEDTAS